MKLCLIKCPSPFLVNEKVFPPLGLMAVGTLYASKGWDVLVHDGPTWDIPLNYDCYGLGPTTPQYPTALRIIEMLNKLTDASILLGGPHVGEYVDYAPLIIDRGLVDIKSYEYRINGRLATTLITAEGCPYNCAFCSKRPAYKARDVELVIAEIQYLHGLGYRALMFYDDIFMLDRERTRRICAYLKGSGIVWRCFVRGDLVVKHGQEMLDMMVDSGCVEMAIGVESGSEAILQAMHKGETVADIRLAIEMMKRTGVRIKGFFIVGLPGESGKTLDETERFVAGEELDDVDFAMFRPYQGSDIYKNKKNYDIDWDELDNAEMYHIGQPGEYQGLVRTSALTAAEIVEARDWLEAEYGSVNCNTSS